VLSALLAVCSGYSAGVGESKKVAKAHGTIPCSALTCNRMPVDVHISGTLCSGHGEGAKPKCYVMAVTSIQSMRIADTWTLQAFY